MSREDAINAIHKSQCLGDDVGRAIATTTARTAQLDAGFYEFWADVDFYYKQGDVTVDAATASSYKFPAGVPFYIAVSGASDDYIAVICDTGLSGNLYGRKM